MSGRNGSTPAVFNAYHVADDKVEAKQIRRSVQQRVDKIEYNRTDQSWNIPATFSSAMAFGFNRTQQIACNTKEKCSMSLFG